VIIKLAAEARGALLFVVEGTRYYLLPGTGTRL
jgi:hypothetical protein